MLVIFVVSNPVKLIDVRFRHSQNIPSIFLVFEVSRHEKSISVRLVKYENIYDASSLRFILGN